jgi:hypothetical protein
LNFIDDSCIHLFSVGALADGYSDDFSVRKQDFQVHWGYITLHRSRLVIMRSWNSSVGIVTRVQAGQSRVQVPAGVREFPLLQNVQTSSEAHPISYSMGTRGSLPGGKAVGHETDHSPPSSVFMEQTQTLPLPYIHSQILSPSSQPILMK